MVFVDIQSLYLPGFLPHDAVLCTDGQTVTLLAWLFGVFLASPVVAWLVFTTLYATSAHAQAMVVGTMFLQ